MEPFVAYISMTCGKGILGYLTETDLQKRFILLRHAVVISKSPGLSWETCFENVHVKAVA